MSASPGWRGGPRPLGTLTVFILGWIPAFLGVGTLAAAAGLRRHATSPTPYWVPEDALLLYVWTPVVVASASLLLLSPGLLLARSLARHRLPPAMWLLKGFALSIPILITATWLVENVLGIPLRGRGFAFLAALCSVAAAILPSSSRGREGGGWEGSESGGSGGGERRAGAIEWATLLLPPLLLLAILAPKLHWEALSGDGAHTMEAVRLLLQQPVPFFGPEYGDIAGWPSTTTFLFLYPLSWFYRLFGDHEASLRVAFPLFLLLVHAALVAVVAWKRGRLPGGISRVGIWLGVGLYALVAAFNFTYDPYFADIALPTSQDTLQIALFLAFVATFLRDERGWSVGFLALLLLGSPNGLLLVALWLASFVLVWREWTSKRVWSAALGVVAVLAVVSVVPAGLELVGLPRPGGEHSAGNLIARFRYLQWADVSRLLFLFLPAGILPVLALLAWPWQDRVARTLTLVTVAYFALFYVQAAVSIHHFAPAMILPLAVLWRMEPADRGRRVGFLAAVMASALVAGVLVWPENSGPHVHGRALGESIEIRTEGYDALHPRAYRRMDVLAEIVPMGWDARVPEESYGGVPLVWNYYAQRASSKSEESEGGRGSREGTPAGRGAVYVLQPATAPSPPGGRLLGTGAEGASLWVLDEAALAAHRGLRPQTPPGAEILARPRDMLFPGGQGRPRVIDVCASFRVKLGIDVCGAG